MSILALAIGYAVFVAIATVIVYGPTWRGRSIWRRRRWR